MRHEDTLARPASQHPSKGRPMSNDTLAWWATLCAVSVLNMLAWALSAVAVRRQGTVLHPDILGFRRWQLLLSAGYVLGCAYRSALPVFDVQRLCLFDTWLSSVIVGRSVATVAELCFAAQWALLLRAVASTAGSRTVWRFSAALVPLIVLAELCSWHAVLTTSNLGHVLEESVWGLCAAGVALSLWAMRTRCSAALRPLLLFCSVAGFAYVAYMFGVGVPMYWARWAADEAMGRPYLSVAQGALDASTRWVVSHRWDDWKSEVTWMSLYFSLAVWLSIGVVHAPVAARRARGKHPGRQSHAVCAR